MLPNTPPTPSIECPTDRVELIQTTGEHRMTEGNLDLVAGAISKTRML